MRNTIKEFLQGNRAEIISDLSDFVRIPSVAADAVNGAIFGIETKNILERCRTAFASAGLDLQLQPDAAYAAAKTEGNGKSIGIFTHADVVTATDEDWIVTRPFAPLEKDGFLCGRGAIDDKSGIVCALWAYKALKHVNALPDSSLFFYIGANEESGMKDIEYFKKREQLPDFSIVPDADYPVGRGEKSIMRFWADFEAPFVNIISIHGGESLNIVLAGVDCEIKYSAELEKQLHALCDGKNELSVTVGDTITLKAKGKPSHAAHPEHSLNALKVLIELLVQCPALGSDIDILKAALPAVADPYSISVGADTTDSDFGATTCTNGIVKTINYRLSLSFDTRYGTEINPDEIIDGYKKHFNAHGAQIRVTERDEGYSIPENDAMILAMNEAYTEVTGEEKKSTLMGGGTYARHLKNSVSVGTFIPTRQRPVLPEGHGDLHQSDEMIDIDGLIKSIEILAHMIIKADKVLNERK